MNKIEDHKKVVEALESVLIDEKGESPGGSSHYMQGEIQPKDLIIRSSLPGYKALALKYLVRAGLKGDEKDPVLDELRDLRKVIFWVNERYKYLVECMEKVKDANDFQYEMMVGGEASEKAECNHGSLNVDEYCNSCGKEEKDIELKVLKTARVKVTPVSNEMCEVSCAVEGCPIDNILLTLSKTDHALRNLEPIFCERHKHLFRYRDRRDRRIKQEIIKTIARASEAALQAQKDSEEQIKRLDSNLGPSPYDASRPRFVRSPFYKGRRRD